MAAAPSVQQCPVHFKGVKNLVDSGVSELPRIYVRPEGERPATSVPPQQELPVIDLSLLHCEDGGRGEIVRQIGEACREWGFFQVVNHGVPHSLLEEMIAVGNEFHALPNDEKMKYFSTDIRSRMRFATSFNVAKDQVLNWRDFLRHDCLPLSEMIHLWPDKPQSYRRIAADYSTRIAQLGLRMLEAISESLGLPAHYINKAFNGYSQVMALNFYPACPQPDLTLGFIGHCDPGSITILLQDRVGGLEVLHDGAWVPVKPIRHALIVNLADQIQLLSNDRYKSIQHRVVVNSASDRISVPVALGPAWDSFVVPAKELTDQEHPAAFRGMVYRDFMLALQAGTLRQSVLESLRI